MALLSLLIRTFFPMLFAPWSQYRFLVTLIPDIRILSLASPVLYSTEAKATTLPTMETNNLSVDVP